jgi:hypothetical protein
VRNHPRPDGPANLEQVMPIPLFALFLLFQRPFNSTSRTSDHTLNTLGPLRCLRRLLDQSHQIPRFPMDPSRSTVSSVSPTAGWHWRLVRQCRTLPTSDTGGRSSAKPSVSSCQARRCHARPSAIIAGRRQLDFFRMISDPPPRKSGRRVDLVKLSDCEGNE